jgi:hypothetical protein
MYVHRLRELLDMARTTRAKQQVKVKAKACKCLQCDKPAARGRRGLCQYHFNQFDNEKRKRPTKKLRDKFDRDEVAAGKVFESRRGRQPMSPNPFASSAS